ncbi:MAG: DUF5107 domain-containing protein [Bacteroidales bacterium]|nr:DUF5107 domain-containing protein [Bacteroidales bacterium]
MKKYLVLPLLLSCYMAAAQTVSVKDTVIRTYNFSDPDPIARTDRVYPYTRFNSFDFNSVERTWKMVVLENDYLRVKIFPEIGGKIWSIFDKKAHQEMFYDNDVIKFREISLRGPWTSGGIEFNYGVIGHAPSCAHPVDWKTVTNPDGSVSCYIGVTELLSGSRWAVEINLPKDAVWVRTRSFWHNYSGEYQPYYTWANSGVTATDDMEIIYPADYTIGHNGKTTPFPYENGRDLRKYSDQRFGMDKSFHPGGSHKGYFGVYWPGDDFGMLHYALRDEKLGRKYFSWAQSEQGSIWVDLLTDGRPQYVELQSGRLFNQNDLSSVETPYKQFLFTPYGTDEWNEYWLPFAGIGGVADMTLRAVVNVKDEGSRATLAIYPLQNLSGELVAKDADGKVLAKSECSLKAAQTFTLALSAAPALVTIDGKKLYSSDTQATDRPHKINPGFSLDSAEGQAAWASYLFGMREYPRAEEKADRALQLNPSLIEALYIKGMLLSRRMDYKAAYECYNKILSIDEYNPQANYNSGLVALKMGKTYDAMDRFELAALTSELRSAAYTRLAEMYFAQGEKELAADYARKSLSGNADNVSACMILYQIEPSGKILDRISEMDPLCHFPDIERMLAGRLSAEALDASIFEELKLQNYYEAAQFYHSLGLDDKALKVLEAAKQSDALLELWKAWFKGDASLIAGAEAAAMDYVFPSRELSAQVLSWAVENDGSWKSKYLLAMLKDSLGDKDGAKALMNDEDVPSAEYYAYRATLGGSRQDLEKAFQLDPEQWRFRNNLAKKYYDEGNYSKAIELTEKYYRAHKENFHVGDTYAKSLIAAGEYDKAEKVLDNIRILPFEGQSGSRVLYRNVKLRQAATLADKGKVKAAIEKVAQARQWPQSLGVGRPYDDLVDERTEDWLDAVLYTRLGDKEKAATYLEKLKVKDPGNDWQALYDKALVKSGKKYPALSPLVSTGTVPVDKKLF